ncbi:F0F1 ATP synthase subunit A [Acidipila sp. EB88]|uniref:F0F1 ATP synthase subunit A n=1 Tax=Acidipila sp. EB88 TaxID=2305226 RepID=UPI000F5F6A20|nr:F0F1 ATP synthase subunit A [Acidipila sp. EB88]RRA49658.1 ATP synthase F0 subunit A [Acidipila sp. EB88]
MLFLLDALSRFLNGLFAGPVVALLLHFGIHPAKPNTPISNALILELVVACGLVLFFLLVRASLSVEKPGVLQMTAEGVYNFVDEQGHSIIGHDHTRYMPFVATILLFVLCCNMIGLLPGIDTPTSSPAVPLGLALLTFVYYNAAGLFTQGPWKYFKHFLGPVWWISWFMLPLEIISHLARVLSLTVRLYANMFASDLLTMVFFSLIPIGIPIVFLALHFGVALIQAYVFMLLAMIYLSGATSHEDEGAV